MRLVEQHIIKHDDPRFNAIDAMAFASKNLWNLATYIVRQAFLFQGTYLTTAALYSQLKATDAYKALPAKVSNQVLMQVDKAWTAFFEAAQAWREHPETFTGRPHLPKYKPKTQGRNLLVFEMGAIWKADLAYREIAISQLGRLVETKQNPQAIDQVRIVPKADRYVVEVIHHREKKKEQLDPHLFVALDLGVNVLAALTSSKAGFVPHLLSGRPLKAWNQLYNKERAYEQKKLAKGKAKLYTTHRLDRITTKRNRRVMHYLHTASRRIIDLLVSEGIGTVVIGKNPFWKQRVVLGKKHNQEFVQIPPCQVHRALDLQSRIGWHHGSAY